eukprot:TRINITY_DN23311_c0_g2_i1.p1 TRINITY_DN23311_c0_g2~~TRINITY_DN23311_c0_g2_i1.p1  ORF type:complete len:1445 (-),score=238.52 TRINITY_DN23311_c0_g2_i1:39-4373(-)
MSPLPSRGAVVTSGHCRHSSHDSTASKGSFSGRHTPVATALSLLQLSFEPKPEHSADCDEAFTLTDQEEEEAEDATLGRSRISKVDANAAGAPGGKGGPLPPKGKGRGAPPPPPSRRRSWTAGDAGDGHSAPSIGKWSGPAPPREWLPDRVVNWQPIRRRSRLEGSVWEQVNGKLQRGAMDMPESLFDGLNKAFMKTADQSSATSGLGERASLQPTPVTRSRLLPQNKCLQADVLHARLVRRGFSTLSHVRWATGGASASDGECSAVVCEVPHEILEELINLLRVVEGEEWTLCQPLPAGMSSAEDLPGAEVFLRELLLTAGPHAAVLSRLEMALFMERFPEATAMERRLFCILNAVRGVINSPALPVLLEGVLVLGNYVNSASKSLGAALGITLDSLAKLAHTRCKANNSERKDDNALLLLARHLEVSHPCLIERLVSDLGECHAVKEFDARSTFDALQSLDEMVKRLQAASASHLPGSQALMPERIDAFLSVALPKLNFLRGIFREIERATHDLKRWFAEPADSRLGDMLSSLSLVREALLAKPLPRGRGRRSSTKTGEHLDQPRRRSTAAKVATVVGPRSSDFAHLLESALAPSSCSSPEGKSVSPKRTFCLDLSQVRPSDVRAPYGVVAQVLSLSGGIVRLSWLFEGWQCMQSWAGSRSFEVQWCRADSATRGGIDDGSGKSRMLCRQSPLIIELSPGYQYCFEVKAVLVEAEAGSGNFAVSWESPVSQTAVADLWTPGCYRASPSTAATLSSADSSVWSREASLSPRLNVSGGISPALTQFPFEVGALPLSPRMFAAALEVVSARAAKEKAESPSLPFVCIIAPAEDVVPADEEEIAQERFAETVPAADHQQLLSLPVRRRLKLQRAGMNEAIGRDTATDTPRSIGCDSTTSPSSPFEAPTGSSSTTSPALNESTAVKNTSCTSVSVAGGRVASSVRDLLGGQCARSQHVPTAASQPRKYCLSASPSHENTSRGSTLQATFSLPRRPAKELTEEEDKEKEGRERREQEGKQETAEEEDDDELPRKGKDGAREDMVGEERLEEDPLLTNAPRVVVAVAADPEVEKAEMKTRLLRQRNTAAFGGANLGEADEFRRLASAVGRLEEAVTVKIQSDTKTRENSRVYSEVIDLPTVPRRKSCIDPPMVPHEQSRESPKQIKFSAQAPKNTQKAPLASGSSMFLQEDNYLIPEEGHLLVPSVLSLQLGRSGCMTSSPGFAQDLSGRLMSSPPSRKPVVVGGSLNFGCSGACCSVVDRDEDITALLDSSARPFSMSSQLRVWSSAVFSIPELAAVRRTDSGDSSSPRHDKEAPDSPISWRTENGNHWLSSIADESLSAWQSTSPSRSSMFDGFGTVTDERILATSIRQSPNYSSVGDERLMVEHAGLVSCNGDSSEESSSFWRYKGKRRPPQCQRSVTAKPADASLPCFEENLSSCCGARFGRSGY